MEPKERTIHRIITFHNIFNEQSDTGTNIKKEAKLTWLKSHLSKE
jgi:hypothetical protein